MSPLMRNRALEILWCITLPLLWLGLWLGTIHLSPKLHVDSYKAQMMPLHVVPATGSNKKRISISTESSKITISDFSCCYYGSIDLVKQIYPQEWRKIYPFLLEGMNENVSGVSNEDYCRNEWKKTVLSATGRNPSNASFYAQAFINKNLEYDSFRYVRDNPNLPRILFLGDSVSRGAWVEIYNLFNSLSLANIHGAPDNCGGFSIYDKYLSDWLGECPWDIIQFNVGLHFHSSDLHEYEVALTKVVQQLRNHSPKASIVFALTTPSPFDSNKTLPNRSTCKNYHYFFQQGFVSALNEVARDVIGPKLDVTISDRYQAVHPLLERYQNPCDVHFTREGYEVLARNDWNLLSKLL